VVFVRGSLEHPAVKECAITAVPDEIRGQIVKATVVLTRDYAPSDDLVEELQDHIRKLTAPYKYPRILEFLPELPKTISGKIRRVELRENDQESKGAET
jgi:acetyl-CoA synthetase